MVDLKMDLFIRMMQECTDNMEFAPRQVLYLDLYVLEGDTLISPGSFMRTKRLCVLIHFSEVGAVKHV